MLSGLAPYMDLGERGSKVTPAFVTSLTDESHRCSRLRPVSFSSDNRQRPKIVRIGWPRAVVACEQLERDQMTDGCHRNGEPRQDLESFGILHNFGFDSGGSEEKVGHYLPFRQADRGQPPTCMLLN